MTLYEIKSAAAAYLEKGPADFRLNDVDLGLIGLNQVRTTAEETNDFNFTRKLLTVSVDGVTGGDLDTAVEYGGDPDVTFQIKTIIDVGLFDTSGNFRPVEWTTVADSLNRQRLDNPFSTVRYPTDTEAVCGPIGQRRFLFGNNKVFYFPRTENVTFDLGIIAYTFTPDWADADVGKDSATYDGPWITKGSQYLLWSLVINLNQLAKGFVFRQEGNLPPPQALADAGLAAIMQWDNLMFEQNRRHSR